MTPSIAPQLVTACKRLGTSGVSGFAGMLTFLVASGLTCDGDEWSMAGTTCARCCVGGGSA